MSQPAITASSLIKLVRRAISWWLAQVSHALPPTIFFLVGFNLILWTKRLILQEHGIEFSGFFIALVAALLIGKAVLVTDNLPFMRRFDGAPLIQPILFKSAIYWLCVLVVRLTMTPSRLNDLNLSTVSGEDHPYPYPSRARSGGPL